MIKNTESIVVNVRRLSEEAINDIKGLHHVYDVKYMNDTLTVKCSGGKHNITHVSEYFENHNIDYDRIYSELPTLNCGACFR